MLFSRVDSQRQNSTRGTGPLSKEYSRAWCISTNRTKTGILCSRSGFIQRRNRQVSDARLRIDGTVYTRFLLAVSYADTDSGLNTPKQSGLIRCSNPPSTCMCACAHLYTSRTTISSTRPLRSGIMRAKGKTAMRGCAPPKHAAT